LRVAKNQDGQRWSEDLVRRVGLAMKKARGNKSAKRLSDETAALGYRVSPAVIAKLDSGHRGAVLSVAELLVLAAALEIPPGLLLFPGYPRGDVEFLPGRTASAIEALHWFDGAGRIPTEGPFDAKTDLATINAGTEIVSVVRQFNDAGRALMFMQTGLSLAQSSKPLTTDRPVREQVREMKSAAPPDRSFLKQQMREMEQLMAELQDQIDNLQPTFEITEKPR
jgi:hypothetical protein